MDWLKKHLNWTWVFGWLLLLPAAFMTGLMTADAPDYAAGDVDAMFRVGATIYMLVLSGWVITQKQRSLLWLLLLPIFSPLWLDNYTEWNATSAD